jgi:DUF1365 family protein
MVASTKEDVVELLECHVRHERFKHKHYKFDFSFFWFKIPLQLFLQQEPSFLAGLYKLKYSDHLKLGKSTLWENIHVFMKQHGIDGDAKAINIFTHLSFLGYLFNPVCFFIIEMPCGKKHAIIQIGNTFNELKPIFVHDVDSNSQNDLVKFSYSSQKNFYISPFTPLDSKLTFRWKQQGDNLSISVIDEEVSEQNAYTTTMRAVLTSKRYQYTWKLLLIYTLKYPLITLQTIVMIHWHAMRLWLKGVPFIKKHENPQLQQGVLPWKIRRS